MKPTTAPDPLYTTLRFADGLTLDAETVDRCPQRNMARPHWRPGPSGPLCGHQPDGDCGCELDLLGRLFRVLPSCPFHGGAA